MKVTFYLQMNSAKGFHKTIAPVSSVKVGRELAAKRSLQPGFSLWVGEYHDGVLFKAHSIKP